MKHVESILDTNNTKSALVLMIVWLQGVEQYICESNHLAV